MEVRAHNAVKPLVMHLNGTHQPLLRNVARALSECAKDKECMLEIEELDGVRLIWSLLKNDSPEVQAEAAWALCPCIMNATVSTALHTQMNIPPTASPKKQKKKQDGHALCMLLQIFHAQKNPVFFLILFFCKRQFSTRFSFSFIYYFLSIIF